MVYASGGTSLWKSESWLRGLCIGCLAVVLLSLTSASALLVPVMRTNTAGFNRKTQLHQLAVKLTQTLQDQQIPIVLFKDTLDHVPDLNQDEQQTLAKITLGHTRHLLGLAIAHPGSPAEWQAVSPDFREQDQAAVEASFPQHPSWRTRWSKQSRHLVLRGDGRPLLVLRQPLESRRNHASLTAVFDLHALLQDFFAFALSPPSPIQVLQNDHRLYQSTDWPTGTGLSSLLATRVIVGEQTWWLQAPSGDRAHAFPLWPVLGLILLAGISAWGMVGLIERLRRLATTDELTGLFNRRYFLGRWESLYRRAKRLGHPLACLMIDVNRFKLINDLFGHSAGDHVLKQIAEELRRSFRQSDILARFGGDEFVAALPETTPDQAASVADKLRQLGVQGPDATPVRLSVGVGYLHRDESPQDILQQADADLYASRNVALKMASPASSATTTAEDNG